MILFHTILYKKYVDPYLKVSIYGSVLNSYVYISLYPYTNGNDICSATFGPIVHYQRRHRKAASL